LPHPNSSDREVRLDAINRVVAIVKDRCRQDCVGPSGEGRSDMRPRSDAA